MKKTTVYLPDELKTGLGRAAAEAHTSEAELIREAVRALIEARRPSTPTVPLFDSGDSTLASRVAERPEEELAGFGES